MWDPKLHGCTQKVKCDTRGKAILNHLYCNVTGNVKLDRQTTQTLGKNDTIDLKKCQIRPRIDIDHPMQRMMA